MLSRPSSDRDLDASIALRAVREQLPWLECRRATPLGSGWATDVYQLDDHLVARFPRNAEAAGWADFDERVLGLVASALGSAFAVPKVVGRGKAGVYFPYDFLVCELVPGVHPDSFPAPLPAELATDLGRALTHIHSIPVDAAHAAGLRETDWHDPAYAGPLRLVHGDFRHGNIILDPRSGRLSGVIDWGNAAVGDPAWDFMTLVLWRGWAFMLGALSTYELPTGDGFLERVRSLAESQARQEQQT